MPTVTTARAATGPDGRPAPFMNAPNRLAEMLATCDSLAEIRALAPLPDEAQRLIDQKVVQVGLERLSIIADVMRHGLIFPLPGWLGVPELYWESDSKVGHAISTMDPMARGERQLIAKTGYRMPVYCNVDDFELSIRTIRTAQRNGYQIDLSHVAQAVRRVNERAEYNAINGADIAVGGNTAPGLLNAPNVNTYTYTGSEAWDVAGHTGDEIVFDTLEMIEKLQAVERFGPYHMWVPTTYWNKLNENFTLNYPGTILERLRMISTGKDANGNEQRLQVSVADRLPADRVVMAEMTDSVLDVVYGQAPTAVSWSMTPMGPFNFAIIGCAILRVKTDSASTSGIVVGNKS